MTVYLLSYGVLLIILISGYFLYRAAHPYPGLLFNIHKLIALGWTIYTGIHLYRSNSLSSFTAFDIAVLALLAIFVIALFVSGALMSSGRTFPGLRFVHISATLLLLISTALILAGAHN